MFTARRPGPLPDNGEGYGEAPPRLHRQRGLLGVRLARTERRFWSDIMTGPFVAPDWPIFHQPWWTLLTLGFVVGLPALFDTFHGRSR